MEEERAMANDDVQPLSPRSEGMPTMAIGGFVEPDQFSTLADELGRRLDLGGTSSKAAVAWARTSALAAVHGRGGRRSPDASETLREARAKYLSARKERIMKRLSGPLRPQTRKLFERLASRVSASIIASADFEERAEALRPSSPSYIESTDELAQHWASMAKIWQSRQKWLVKRLSDPHLHLTPEIREFYEKSVSRIASVTRKLQERAESFSSNDYDSNCRMAPESSEKITQPRSSMPKHWQSSQVCLMKRLSDPNFHLTRETRASCESELSLTASTNPN